MLNIDKMPHELLTFLYNYIPPDILTAYYGLLRWLFKRLHNVPNVIVESVKQEIKNKVASTKAS